MTLVQSAFSGLFNASLPSPTTYTYDAKKRKFISSELSIFGKTAYYTSNFFKALLITSALPVAASFSLLNYLKNKSIEWIIPRAKKHETVMSEKEVLQELAKMQLGPSDSTFQSCGIGNGPDISRPAFEGRCNWAKAVEHPVITDSSGNKKILINSSTEELRASYRNILDYPKGLVNILNKIGATAYRFSIERSVIEPKPGVYDKAAIEKYIKLCKELKKAGIEPWVTLDHYTSPEWFAESGGFHNEENIDNFVEYACGFIERLYNEAKVTKFMTFNELNGTGFCTEFMQFNPLDSVTVKENNKSVVKPISGLRASFTNIKNRMRAHCTIFERMKDLRDLGVEIALTHQSLKFDACNSYNLIERITCYALTFISHYFVFNFFKDGCLQAPFFMNTHIANGEKLLTFLGIQGYGHSYLKVGFGTGEEPSGIYPLKKFRIPLLGYFTKYHTFEAGNTSPDTGGKVQNFGPAVKVEDFEHDLEEATSLNVKVAVTENGCDLNIGHFGENGARADEATQEDYYKKIFPIIAKFKVMAYFFWTFFKGQHEWNNGVGSNGKGILLGVADAEKDSATGKLTGKYTLSPAGKHIQTTLVAARALNKPSYSFFSYFFG